MPPCYETCNLCTEYYNENACTECIASDHFLDSSGGLVGPCVDASDCSNDWGIFKLFFSLLLKTVGLLAENYVDNINIC